MSTYSIMLIQAISGKHLLICCWVVSEHIFLFTPFKMLILSILMSSLISVRSISKAIMYYAPECYWYDVRKCLKWYAIIYIPMILIFQTTWNSPNVASATLILASRAWYLLILIIFIYQCSCINIHLYVISIVIFSYYNILSQQNGKFQKCYDPSTTHFCLKII